MVKVTKELIMHNAVSHQSHMILIPRLLHQHQLGVRLIYMQLYINYIKLLVEMVI